jgi:predicted nucleic acid-binding protein
MKQVIVLDSTPLGLLVQPPRFVPGITCRQWMKRHVDAGAHVIVPEIVHYELRRELLRLGKTAAANALIAFNHDVPGRYLPITTAAIDLAAELWAEARRRGKPTADPHALDVDVILAAQVLAHGLKPSDFVVATSNVSHLAQFVPAEEWGRI